MLKSRIQPIDGLRMIAAFGVVWLHTWGYFGFPSLQIGAFDFYQLVAILGNGVDFFFVISGFCMYLVAGDKEYSLGIYWQFIKKRFLRVAPVFYVAIFMYGILKMYTDPAFPLLREAIFHFLFLNNVTGSTISSPFWSIATEWDFYLLLPVLVLMNKKYPLRVNLLLLSFTSILLLCVAYKGFLNVNFWQWQLFVRFPEFAAGIYAAYCFKKNKSLPRIFDGGKGLLFAFIIMYLGRTFKFTPFVEAMGSAGFLFQSISNTIMVSGFAILLFHVVTQRSVFSAFLSGRTITWLGRISYSVYLWHSLVIYLVAEYFVALPFLDFNVVVAFIVISIFTVIISVISYSLLEAFYFKRSNRSTRPRSETTNNALAEAAV